MTPVLVTPLRRIPTAKGDVLHGLKAGDAGFAGFGEAYFAIVHEGMIKGWKRHTHMTLNLICVDGAVRVVIYPEIGAACCLDMVVSPERTDQYCRLTVPPRYWVGFQGVSPGRNMLLNVASLMHDPAESETLALDAFPWPEPE